MLPEPGAAPRVLAVLETDYLNAVQQEIVFETHSRTVGQNAIYAVFFGPVKGRTGSENLRKDDWLNDEVLDDEMLERMPGVTMHVSNYFVQNRYGPFNYAIGNAGNGELCIYGWQRINSQTPMYAFIRSGAVLALRLRMCQIGASEQDLLRLMYRFSINGYFLPQSWQPYGRPVGEPEGLGQVGGPLAYPSGLTGDGTVLDGWLGPDRSQAAPARARPARRYGSSVPPAEPVYSGGEPMGYPQGNLVDPADGYPQVPGPAASGQMAPSSRATVTPGVVQPGAVVTPAPSRAVQSEGEASPFSRPPVLPGTTNYAPAATGGAVGDPIRLVPGASAYPVPSQ
ncbi:hypothetical protein FHS55_003981 [Angulomicrobium tetraedrale]|uniref:Cellulose biosynthesis protein BcsN n=1 Tax=Ancylobacter tetraedralis TaxID=217068 RepID=A0A839ZFC3_9HYPH|nr:hypothetical protein [Ancylobacter tetraedralis]